MNEKLSFKMDIKFAPNAESQKVLTQIANKEENLPLVYINSQTVDGKICRVTVELEALGEVLKSEFGYSVLVKFTNQDDATKLELLEDLINTIIPDEFTYKPFVKDEKFFLKLAVKDDKFRSKITPTFTPANYEKSPIKAGSVLQAVFQPNIWIQPSNNTGGMYLNLFELLIDGGKKRSKKSKA